MREEESGLFLLGLTGGIASGKSTVAGMFAELGAVWIDFDLLAREVVEPGTQAKREIVDFFGRKVLREDGELDRGILSDIVFADAEKRKVLERITHPRIFQAFERRVKEIGTEDPKAVILADVPLLFELGLQERFNKVLLVYIPETLQIERLALRNRISLEQAAALVQAQLSIEEKKACADFLIDNSGSLEKTREQVGAVWKTISKQGEAS